MNFTSTDSLTDSWENLKKGYNFKFENILENTNLFNLFWIINVPVTCPVSNRHRGLHNEKSSIPLQLGVVINRNFILLVGRAWKGRSGRHRNSISRQMIILLRAPNLWSGILRYPLNHPFHLSVSLSCVFPFTRFLFVELLQMFEKQNLDRTVDLRLKSHRWSIAHSSHSSNRLQI